MYVPQRICRSISARRNWRKVEGRSGKDGTRFANDEDRLDSVPEDEATVGKFETRMGKEEPLGKYMHV